jgi:hypothetical protein
MYKGEIIAGVYQSIAYYNKGITEILVIEITESNQD